MKKTLLVIFAALMSFSAVAHDVEKEDKSWWWEDSWYEEGQIRQVTNHKVVSEVIEYDRADITIPAMVARPADKKKYPAIIFMHGRRGLDKLLQRQVKRIAARGFVVLAPKIYEANFVEPMPYRHVYSYEDDFNAGIDVLLARKDISTSKACVVSHTRGGYYSLKVMTKFNRQNKDIACYVSYYPHWQDPNAPEPAQVYGFAPEVEDLNLPIRVFIGEDDQYHRMRVLETSFDILNKNNIDAKLIVYPGVGRGFDFRPPHSRTFADDLASKDAIQRMADFIRKHLNN